MGKPEVKYWAKLGGKTFTMGTSANNIGSQNQQGIIPRVIEEIFHQVK